MQAPCGVEYIDIIAAKPRLGFGALCNRLRVFTFDDGQGIHANLLAKDGQLLHRGRAVCVKGCHQHALAFALLQALGQFRGCCGFP